MKPRTVPPLCGLEGWPSAWAVLERVGNERTRDLLSGVVRSSGIEGRGLAYFAGLVRQLTGDSGDAPKRPRGMAFADLDFIERRARQATRPLYGDDRLPRMRRPR